MSTTTSSACLRDADIRVAGTMVRERLPHKLPVEILRNLTCILDLHPGWHQNLAGAVVLAQTCRAAYTWMVPEMYRSVTLSVTRQPVAFHRTLMSPSLMDYAGTRHALGPYVRHLWIGPTRSSYSKCDLRAVANIACDILCACSSLRTLAIIYGLPNVICAFASKIPATVETLYVGQVHRTHNWDWPNMSCYPRLRRLVTWEFCGYWTPAMYKAIVSSPYLRICRRYIHNVPRMSRLLPYWFDSVTKVADTLERMEIVACIVCLVAEAEIEREVRLQYEDASKATISPDRLFIEVNPVDRDYIRNQLYVKIYNDWIHECL